MNLELPKLSLGTWQVSGWESSDLNNFLDTLSAAKESGLNFIDTAAGYGDGLAEEKIGQFVSKDREKWILASKFPYNIVSIKDIHKELDNSLKRLKTDYLDIYYQHWPSKTLHSGEVILALKELKAAGKIKAIGVSNWRAKEFSECKDLINEIDFFQPCYNLLYREIEDELISICENNSIKIIPYSPLCQGLLTGRFLESTNIPNDSRQKNIFAREDLFPHLVKFLKVLNKVSAEIGATNSQIAIRWLLEQRGITSVIIGCSNSEQLKENLGALKISIGNEQINELTEAGDRLKKLTSQSKSLWNWHPRGGG